MASADPKKKSSFPRIIELWFVFFMSLSQNVRSLKSQTITTKGNGIKLRGSDHYKGQLKEANTLSHSYLFSPPLFVIQSHLIVFKLYID